MCDDEKQFVENFGDPNNIYLNYEGRRVDKCPDGLFLNDTKGISRCNPNMLRKIVIIIWIVLVNIHQKETYLTSSGECVSVCQNGENYIGEYNKCLSICKENNGKEFYQK